MDVKDIDNMKELIVDCNIRVNVWGDDVLPNLHEFASLILGVDSIPATVKDVTNTADVEPDFDYEYHRKYIGLTGHTIPHNLKPGKYKHHVCLGFNPDENGRYQDADWFNMYDLELV
jgi:hypothetical protein